MIDVLVVGGGPVGLVSAIHAAQAGLSVSVLEPRGTPIDKACGEGIMPDALGHLAGLAVHPAGLPFYGIRYLQGTHAAEARFQVGPGRGVRRTDLQRALSKRVAALGIDVVEQRVTEIEQAEHWVQAGGIRARYLIGADGLHSTVRRAVGAQRGSGGRLRYGLRQHFAVAPWTDLVEVYWTRDVEVYVTPISATTVGIAVLGGAPLNLLNALKTLPELTERLVAAEPASDLRGAGPLRQRATQRVVGRTLLVGDAAGYVDALTGEGLRVGFQEAAAAIECIRSGRVDAYEGEWRQITRSYRALTRTLLWYSGRPALRRTIVPSAQALPTVFAALVNSLTA